MTPDQARAAADLMATVWEGETGTTEKVLAAVDKGNRDYKPDPKSRSAWEVAVHIATADVWFLDSIVGGKFEFNPEAAKKAEAQFTDGASLQAFYAKAMSERLEAIRAMKGEDLLQPLSFFGIMEWPRVRFVGFANNHSVHHRGQLAAYLRAMGSKVPDIYGPSADSKEAAAT
ncbi:MAG: hypothetical protein FJW14_04625 [Acidimicrobiia bacterium]|nr:hypothetical protein [Acidimicrobiia bacterium]